MASKSLSPGHNKTVAPTSKQARSRKAAAPNVDVGRAGSAGGIILEKENVAKAKSTQSASKVTPVPSATKESSSKTQRRKPRKLNKEPASTTPTSASQEIAPAQLPTAFEIEALKSRVHGLESKVEELYKSGSLDGPGRSPRRRGKGRKGSSQQQVPTMANNKAKMEDNDDDDVEDIGRGYLNDEDEDGVEELVRLEGELEVARQDLAAFRPHKARTNTEDEDIEEIPREDTATSSASNRHVTLSGSYRIPLPTSVSVDDVKHIQSGVSAAQNVARSFLEQRRAAATINPNTSAQSAQPPTQKSHSARQSPRSISSSMQVIPADAESGGKQSWSEWIGGYSVAISRAVKNIEHEAAVESQRNTRSHGTGSVSGGGRGGTRTKKSPTGTEKRPVVKTNISQEQAEGLMR